jgi:hypothetical protein
MEVINCYYDKQTTAMREREIGCKKTTHDIVKSGTTYKYTETLYPEEQLTGTI